MKLKQECEERTKKLSEMNTIMITMQKAMSPEANALQAAQEEIAQLKASANKDSNEEDVEEDDYAGLDQLATQNDLKDAEANLFAVRQQYYKHIKTLTHKCSNCQHASKKSQRGRCYNEACKDPGNNKAEKEDSSLLFNHEVLARQAKMSAPPSNVSEASHAMS